MARALLLALTCAAAASAARYVDYSGVKMPVYGSAGDYEAPRDAAHAPSSDDYHGHSPDAPASLDYKYEEEPRIKTEKPTKDSDDLEGWGKSGRKQRGLMRPMEGGGGDVGSKYDRDEDDVPKFRFSYRNPKHRSRIKNDAPPREEDAPPRRPMKYNRDRKDDVSDNDRKDYFHVDKEDFPDDKSKEFDEDVKFLNEATTRRLSRRKARDRQIKRKNNDLDAYEEELEAERQPKFSEVEKEEGRRTRPAEARGRFRPVIGDDEDDPAKVQPLVKKQPSKTYEDYDDYYDMKRVYSIKNKLPSLLRRTSVRVEMPSPTSFLELLMPNRRKLAPFQGIHEPAQKLITPQETSSETAATNAKPTTSTATTTTTTTTTTSTTTTSTTERTTTINDTELSLAEKSRLSIMKKDQRKAGLHHDPTTKKPPVLLQVTRMLPTVVMVEPPSSLAPWMRARELDQDSPQRLDRIKKLMRHKMVANAKSIHDLTDKWDDMVCDYIDVSLLENACAPVRVSVVLALVHASCLVIL